MTRKLMWIFLGIFIVLTAYNITVLRPNLPTSFYIFVTTQFGFGFAILHASRHWNWRAALTLFVISFVVRLTLESLGVSTGLVSGPYQYT